MKLAHAVTAIAAATLLSTTVAEAQTTLYGCYVKNTGTVYRIKTANTPTKCSSNSTEFSWNMEGQVGPQGPQGPQGPAGPSGSPGVRMSGGDWTVPAGQYYDLKLNCGSGETVVSGGYSLTDPTAENYRVTRNTPYKDYDGPDTWEYGWYVQIRNTSASSLTVNVFVLCQLASN